MPQPLLDIQSLSFRYRAASSHALQDIHLHVNEGESIVIMGPNEAGKSTLCFTLNGLIPHLVKGAFDGSVRLQGMDTREWGVRDFFPLVGLVFQDFESQLFSTSVELEVAFGPENLGLSYEQIAERIERALDMTALSPLRRRQPGTLSGGQKQLLAIASVLSLSPKLLCLDEPTTDLDPMNKRRIFRLREKLADRNQTLILVEHETEEALSAHRVVLMQEGKIIADGPPNVIFRDIDLLEKCSVMPLQVAELFHKLDFDELPLSVNDALEEWKRRPLALPTNIRERLQESDQARAQHYRQPFIVAEDVHFSYATGTEEALRGVSLQVREGEFLAILGQNGSGKTTLAKLLNGLLKPSAGEIRIGETSTAHLSPSQIGQKIGYVFQNPDHQIFKETVLDEVLFGPRNMGIEPEQAERQVRDALETVGLWERREEDPFTLPKGLRQKVAVASVLATRPRAIVMDEPTTGLDYGELKQMMALVKRLNQNGHTIIMITHCIWLATQYAHRTVLMSRGEIIADGATREIFAREDLLAQANITPPQIVSFSNRLGTTILSVDEFLEFVSRQTSIDGKNA
jgi:energy-coupling factor transporter ATP-binding protein EcfA2